MIKGGILISVRYPRPAYCHSAFIEVISTTVYIYLDLCIYICTCVCVCVHVWGVLNHRTKSTLSDSASAAG